MIELLLYLLQGDGAPAENDIESVLKKQNINQNHVKHKQWTLRIRLELDLVSISLFLLALATRLYNLEEPKYIVYVSNSKIVE